MQLNKMKKAELIEECRKNGLGTDGTEEELRTRLKEFLVENTSSQSSRSNSVTRDNVDELKNLLVKMQEELAALKQENARQNQSQSNHDESDAAHTTEEHQQQQQQQQQQPPNGVSNENEDSVNGSRPHTQSSCQRQVNSANQFTKPSLMNTSHEVRASNQNSGSFAAFSFRDIEHALNSFTGTGNYRIET
ncbi:putative uncharacterized protein DDB_G0279653 [Sitodiplosis mosellana]|uniref:putative uncharacterized protein DDB_G0279653 n=1 Tax=Sitodiplosis mosellana TaxID=263140 RepID=UPI002444E8C8|nr:putative uncharacterized protein DDB_G0279653 [Sitodiplosis mosellana]